MDKIELEKIVRPIVEDVWFNVRGINPVENQVKEIVDALSNRLGKLVMPKVEFTPIVAHIVIKNKIAEELLEKICSENGNEFYIDYTQSFTSYKAEQK